MIKLGVIGTNWITQQFVEAAVSSTKFELTTVYSRQLDTAVAFGKRNGFEEFFDDLDEFYDHGKFNTVYIASPNSLHFEQAVKALESGKHLIVEKPAFENQRQMETILELLKAHPQLRYFEAARNIHTANFQAIEAQVKKMPVIQGANFTYMKYSSRYDNVLAGMAPNVFSLQFAGGALQDLGVYTVYDSVTLFGVPEDVYYYPQLIRTRVDGKGTAILSYDEFDVVLNFGKIVNSHMPSEIYGLKDSIVIDDAGEIKTVDYYDQNGNKTSIGKSTDENPMLPEVLDFARIIDNPNDVTNNADYTRWLNLSVQVNKVLFNLRQSGKITFTDEK